MTTESAPSGDTPALSAAVDGAVSRFAETEPVAAATLAEAVLAERPPELVAADVVDLPLEGGARTGAEARPVAEWLGDIRALFDPDRVDRLDGRAVIFGLGLLDGEFRRRLEEEGVLDAVESAYETPVTELLTEAGRSRRMPADTVPTHPDRPLERPGDDEFRRVAFARYLARRIYDVSSTEAYSIHLYGPWGSGKSTLLNFLETELGTGLPDGDRLGGSTDGQSTFPAGDETRAAASSSWQVVRFNAWQHQHVDPPWWALLDNVFQQSKSHLRLRHRLAEYWWRLRSGRLGFFLGLATLAWIAAFAVPFLLRGSGSFGNLAATADSLGKILAVGVTVWGGVQAFTSSLLGGSARAARSYVEAVGDPMNTIEARFEVLVDRIPTHVAVFVDDLDRCDCAYVVDLLEGIQTLFTDAPVVFVVAADRQWLNDCFEEVYASHESSVDESGKSLGGLFLEKTFQFSVSVPPIPEEMKRSYWDGLLQVTPPDESGTERESTPAADAMRAATSEEEILRVVDETEDSPFAVQQSVREEAVVRLAAPDIVERTEHVLRPLAPLLEPNPRGMKRLVNAYSVNRALATLAHVSVARDELALWTILSLQYPALASALEADPQLVDHVGGEPPPSVAADLAPLLTDERVIDIVRGRPVDASLDAETVERCARIRQS